MDQHPKPAGRQSTDRYPIIHHSTEVTLETSTAQEGEGRRGRGRGRRAGNKMLSLHTAKTN